MHVTLCAALLCAVQAAVASEASLSSFVEERTDVVHQTVPESLASAADARLGDLSDATSAYVDENEKTFDTSKVDLAPEVSELAESNIAVEDAPSAHHSQLVDDSVHEVEKMESIVSDNQDAHNDAVESMVESVGTSGNAEDAQVHEALISAAVDDYSTEKDHLHLVQITPNDTIEGACASAGLSNLHRIDRATAIAAMRLMLSNHASLVDADVFAIIDSVPGRVIPAPERMILAADTSAAFSAQEDAQWLPIVSDRVPRDAPAYVLCTERASVFLSLSDADDSAVEQQSMPMSTLDNENPSSDAPAASSDAPAASSDAPAASSDAPAASSDAPAASSDAPAESSDAQALLPGSADPVSEMAAPSMQRAEDEIVQIDSEAHSANLMAAVSDDALEAIADSVQEENSSADASPRIEAEQEDISSRIESEVTSDESDASPVPPVFAAVHKKGKKRNVKRRHW